MRSLRFGLAAIGAAAALAVAAVGLRPAQAADPAPVQKERLATMKAINQAMREIKVYSGKGDFAKVAASATQVAELTAKIPGLSPEGSNLGETRIKPEVWKNFAHYKELAEKGVSAAKVLVQAAGKKDRAATLKTFSDLANACTACHEPYRVPKKGD